MPELPEVETIRIQLFQLIIGLTIKNIDIISPKSFMGNPKLLIGTKITGLRRFAKILVIDFDNLPSRLASLKLRRSGQTGGLSLVVHLKMTGQLIYKSSKFKVQSSKLRVRRGDKFGNLPNKYTRVIIYFSDSSSLSFNDLRKFGWMRIVKSQISNLKTQKKSNIPSLEELIKNIGPDALTIDIKEFKQILKPSKKPIKLLLMDQERIGGVGNIYANEALFISRINPLKPANETGKEKADSLLKNLKQVLKKGIRMGGASDNDYLNARGEKGKMQEYFLVYGRKKENCLNKCGGKIGKIKLGGRGTYFCPKCQL